SRMPVLCPREAIFASVPPQVCSTSSRCAAMARISTLMFVFQNEECSLLLAVHQKLRQLFHRLSAGAERRERGHALRNQIIGAAQRLLNTEQCWVSSFVRGRVFACGLA